MPRIGMEPIRRQALIEAAVETIGERGDLDVTMGAIARRAGVSPALAHHYFGAKEALFAASMRHLLREFGASVAGRLRGERDPRRRVRAIVAACFAPDQFAPETVAAWLAFYGNARRQAEARRLMTVYARRLHSNLVDALRPLAGAEAGRIAEGVAAMIDGLYIRRALGQGGDAASAIALVARYVDNEIGGTAR